MLCREWSVKTQVYTSRYVGEFEFEFDIKPASQLQSKFQPMMVFTPQWPN